MMRTRDDFVPLERRRAVLFLVRSVENAQSTVAKAPGSGRLEGAVQDRLRRFVRGRGLRTVGGGDGWRPIA